MIDNIPLVYVILRVYEIPYFQNIVAVSADGRDSCVLFLFQIALQNP